MEVISRKEILKLLFHPLEKVKLLNKKQFEVVCKNYPIVQQVHSIVWEFKSLFKNGNPETLLTWIEQVKQLNISEMNSFITGIERDIDAVKNAIIYEYNNGLAEGSINKIKVIKRIMYGRCNFETLKRKVLLLERMKEFN